MSRSVIRSLLPKSLRACATALAFVVLAAGLRAQQFDELEQKDGKKVSGTVQVAAYDHLEIKAKQGAKQNVPWENVSKLRFGGANEFNEIVDKLGTANLDESLAGLNKLKGDEKLRPVLKQEVLFFLASTLARKGDMDGAAAAWQELLKAFPTGRYLDFAVRGLVETMLAKGQAKEAGAALDAAANEAKAANPGPRFDATVLLLKARLLEAQGDFPKAQAAYDQVEKSGNIAPDQAAVASLGIGRCLQMTGKLPDAESRYRKIATSADAPRYVLAGAWNGIGDILLKAGKDKRDADVLTQALYAFLRGVVLYLPLEGEPANEHMRALDSAAQACDFIAQVDANGKALYTQRSAELKDKRKRLYGAPAK